ncbi:MAG: hypothetical protein Q4C24_01565 [Candidatus Saccharibacteria bacterium]|uniref:Uncharacterized protein n=1 Tax=Candidatus Nanosyncoccus alces TaxID=2171997 RepID=A0ABY0FPQ7_9BACT|nr:hypothetical protein [Candidatus Nanosyncoccus alces]MDO4398959.1 hypothetical protein [Candidatus Saccharibacteria bacterium]RYC75072.1 hypothetical protein G3RUM_00002 [Candidatus Nanosyncoccus alces]
MNIEIELAANIDPSHKRIALVYYQHSFDNYQYYEILSDGNYTAVDTPIMPTNAILCFPPEAPNIPFKYQYEDGLLIVDVEHASWFLAILNIAYPGFSPRKRYMLYTTRTDYKTLEAEITSKIKSFL